MLSKSFFKSSFIYTLSGTLPMASGLVLLPFYTSKLYVSDFGILALLISVTLLSQVIFNFSFDSYIGVKFNELLDEPEKRKKSISSIFVSMKIIGVPIVLLCFFLLFYWGTPVFGIKEEHISFVFFSIITGFFNSYFKTFTSLLVFQNRPGLYFFVNLFNFILTVGISLLGLELLPFSLIGPVYGRLFSGLLVFLLALFIILKENGFYYKKDVIHDWFKFCLPFLLFTIIFWLLSNFDKFIINYNLTKEDVGIYDFALKCAILIEFIQNGLSVAVYPEVFRIYKQNGSNSTSIESNRFFSFFTLVTLVSIVLFNAAMPFLIRFFIKNEVYYQVFSFLGIIAVSYAIRPIHYMFFSSILYLKKTQLFIYAFGLSAVFQITLTFFLTNKIGLAGAVYGVVLVKPVQAFLLYYFVKKHFSFRYNQLKLLYLPAIFILFNLFYWSLGFEYNSLYNFIVLLVTLGLIVFVYKKEMTFFIEKYLKKRLNRGNSQKSQT